MTQIPPESSRGRAPGELRGGHCRAFRPVSAGAFLLASGALGLLSKFVIPAIGTAAGAGLVLYFLLALGAHLRVHDHDPGRLATALTFLALSVAALVVGLAYHGPG